MCAVWFSGPVSLIRDLGAYVAIFTAHNPRSRWLEFITRYGKNSGKTAALYPVGNTGRAIAMFYFASPHWTITAMIF